MKTLADGFVGFAAAHLIWGAFVVIFSTTSGPEAFVAGAAFIGAILFTDYYARETIEGYAE